MTIAPLNAVIIEGGLVATGDKCAYTKGKLVRSIPNLFTDLSYPITRDKRVANYVLISIA